MEILAPDRASAGALLREAGSRFRVELVETPGSLLIVRLQPAAASTGWVFELLVLVERWLEARGLPVANARYGGRSYLIPASHPDREWHSAADPLAVG